MIAVKKETKKTLVYLLSGIPVGIVSGLFGSGGGMLAVPLLKKFGLKQNNAHANAVAVILPIAALSAIMYILRGYVSPGRALVYIPAGLLGAPVGAWLIGKISEKLLRRIFGGFMVYAGIRMVIG